MGACSTPMGFASSPAACRRRRSTKMSTAMMRTTTMKAPMTAPAMVPVCEEDPSGVEVGFGEPVAEGDESTVPVAYAANCSGLAMNAATRSVEGQPILVAQGLLLQQPQKGGVVPLQVQKLLYGHEASG